MTRKGPERKERVKKVGKSALDTKGKGRRKEEKWKEGGLATMLGIRKIRQKKKKGIKRRREGRKV